MKFDYIEQYEKLHNQNGHYGASATRYLPEISLFVEFIKPKTVLDYGCGKGVLSDALKEKYPDIKIYKYDPAIKEYSTIPINKADMIICQDVLEHIPENILPEVIENISTISDKVFFGLNHALSGDILPNGEDAHCTIKEPDWYVELFKKYFNKVTLLRGHLQFQTNALTFEVPTELKKQYFKILTGNLRKSITAI